METGKVEYAPDYKSKSQVRRIAAQTGKPYPDMAAKFTAMELRAEHQRLQVAVAEAAKARRIEQRRDSLSWPIIELCGKEDDAVDALIAFEAEHKIGVENG